MRPAARPDSTGAMDGLVSQRIAVMGCPAVAISRRRACSPGGRGRLEGPISSSRRRLMRQRAHWPGVGWPGSLQAGQSAQAGGAVQSAHSGPARVPEAIAARRPHAEQAACRRWQAGHQGWPVAREMPHGVVSPQMEQASSGSGGQREHSGPSGVRRSTGRRRPQPMQVSRLAGSAVKQFAHSGLPSSRVTGSRRAPQRAHCSMRECAMHVRQTRTPSSGLSMRTTRRQRGQAGRTIPATPAACSASTSRGIARSGARWPSPVSNEGRSSSAQASFCWYEGRGAERRTAAAITSWLA